MVNVLEAEAPTETFNSQDSVLESNIVIPKPTVQELIILKAREYGLNETTALRIAKCESGFNPNAKSPISSASGVFQFVSGTWLGVVKARGQDYTLADRFDYEKNIDNAMWLAKSEGWQHWQCK